MLLLKCGLFIPEINDCLLRAGISIESIDAYYDRFTQFELSDQQGKVYPTTESVLCIAHNLISRGYPTWCSLNLASGLLQRNFPGTIVSYSAETNRCHLKFVSPFSQALKSDERDIYQHLLSEWPPTGLSFASSHLGTRGFQVFSLLEDLRKVAFIQKSLIFALFAHYEHEKLAVYIDIEDSALSDSIVDDLNHLLSAVSCMVTRPVPLLRNTSSYLDADLIVGTSWGKFDNYRQFAKPYLHINAFPIIAADQDKDSKRREPNLALLFGEAIAHEELGRSRDFKDQNIPEFEFHDPAKEQSLLYFLNNIFRKPSFRPGQLAIINRALQNKDVIGLLPTGGGKSLCFQLCGLLQPGINLVIDPINSLMKDQYDKLCEYAIQNAGFINTLNNRETKDDERSGKTLNDITLERFTNGELLFLFISPERLVIEKFRMAIQDCIQQGNLIHYCIIDEAHCVSEWGHDFRIPYLRLADNLRRFCFSGTTYPTLFALTATASYDVLSDVQREMGLQADSIISLPPEAIDRKELSFHFINLGNHEVSAAYPAREFQLQNPKYHNLQQLLQSVPSLIKKKSQKSLLLDDDLEGNFFKPKNGKYYNAGIIFCPTRSLKLPSGVMSVYKYISEKFPELKVGTYFSATDSETVLESEIDDQAGQSTANQEKFLKNDLNLMICTKGFGMGIDKPNLRYTIHYAFPSSIESFYQEAGRAGRDKQQAVCSILYHPADENTTLDLLDKSFRGVAKEMAILEELLTEVRYEPRFFLDQVEDYLRSELEIAIRLNLWPKEDPNFIYINGPYVQDRELQKGYGALRLSDLSHLSKSVQNVDQKEVEKVIELISRFFHQQAPNGNFKEWVTRKKAPGVRTTLSAQSNGTDKRLALQIGFSNDIVDELEKTLKPSWESITTRVIKAGYSFSNTPGEFIENLTYRYSVHLENLRRDLFRQQNIHFSARPIREVIAELPPIDEITLTRLREAYFRIRLMNDTQRAVYRMIQIGIVDDYSIDYASESIVVHFTSKHESAYIEQLKVYLRRYLGQDSLVKQLQKYKSEELDGFLRPLKILTDFFQVEVRAKRHRSLKTMRDFCETAIKNGEEEFRQNIVLYFTSKFAKPNYLPEDLDGGKSEGIHVFEKYIHFLQNPPDELGSEKDNTRHLLGACTRLKIAIGNRNHTLNLLNAFAWFALADERHLLLENEKNAALLKEVDSAIAYFSQQNGWPKAINLLAEFYRRSVNINSDVKIILSQGIDRIIVRRLLEITTTINNNLKYFTYGDH